MIVDTEKLDWDKLLKINAAGSGLINLEFNNKFFIRCFANNKNGKIKVKKYKEKIKKTIKDFLMQESIKQKIKVRKVNTRLLEIEIPGEMNVLEEQQIKEIIDLIVF